MMTHRANVTPPAEGHRSEWNLESAKGCQCVSVDSPLPSCGSSLSSPHCHLQSEQLLPIMVMSRASRHRKIPSFTKFRCLCFKSWKGAGIFED